MRILAIGAHPDDIEISLFGTLDTARRGGAELVLAIATDGSRGGRKDPVRLREIRRAEAIAAACFLDTEPRFLDFPDGTLVCERPLVETLKALIADARPSLILTHAPNDYHGDHRALSAAVSLAASFAAPVAWCDTIMGVGFLPTHMVDITASFPQKLKAIRCHVSQDPERFIERVTLQNEFRAR